VPDIEGTARIVLHDWNMGKIAYYTQPPAVHASHGASAAANSALASASVAADGTAPTELDGSRIVAGFDAAFDLAALLGEADAEALGGGSGVGRTPAPAPPQRRYAALEADEDEATALEEDTEPILPAAPPSPPSAAPGTRKPKLGDASFTSSLGKRRRGMDAEEPMSDSESDEEEVSSARALSPLSDDEAPVASSAVPLASAGEGVDAAAAAAAAARANEPEWKQRERAKAEGPALAATKARGRTAELGAFFSAAEMAGLAESRGAARKRAKKAKKRDTLAGAGLVQDLEAAMNIAEPQPVPEELRGGKSKKNKKKKAKAKTSGAGQGGQGAFAALLRQGEGMEEEL
jgi:nuclear GTP-binding protein